jgi:mercuric ion transport protein
MAKLPRPVPGIAFAFLPKLACPACWPAYAGLLSSVGMGFLVDAAYLFPLTAVFLVLAGGALGFRAGDRRGYGPSRVGLAAALVVLVGKFVFDSNTALYGGIGVVIAASVWNAWPQRQDGIGFCPQCVQQKPAIDRKYAPSRRF